jgi:transposase-like protein
MSKKQRRQRRSFSPEYKTEAVGIVKAGEKTGTSIGQVAKNLDLTESALRKWVEAHDEGGRIPESDQAELHRLRREVQQLRMERDFLKKAAAFFAKETT